MCGHRRVPAVSVLPEAAELKSYCMIRKNGYRFSEKIMLKQIISL
jgi:hypothetical protein